jgi:hypothetical protein
MSTPKPTTGPESPGDGDPVVRMVCPSCERVVVFSGPRPSFCGFCGKPLPGLSPAGPEATQPTTHDMATLPPLPGPAVVTGLTPTEVGGYRLLRRLGSGGMGSVFEAEEVGGGRHVAIKLIAPGQELSTDSVERFRREGRLASALSGPRCVFVYAADEDAGRPYIVMELMPGRTLADLVRERGPLPPAEAVEKALDVLDGLNEAHQHGVVHRDVKPSNCFLEADGRVKVGDFGLSKSLVADVRLTQSGSFLGTPLYASPEQVRSEALGPQSDVYSLAATLYFLLAGQAPFEGGDAAATLARIVSDPPPPLRERMPNIPAGLERAVLRGLERDRSRRWHNLDEFRQALLPFASAGQVAAGPAVRFAAFVADVLCLLVVANVISFARIALGLASPATYTGSTTLDGWLMSFLIWFCCFPGPEWLWGCTAGKWLLGLRVCRPGDVEPPGLIRSLVRYLVFFAGVSLPAMILVVGQSRGPFETYMASGWRVFRGLLFYPAELFTLGLLFSTMRARNGWRGLHEFASGTRVIQLASRSRVKARATDVVSTATAVPLDLPAKIGPFEVTGALRWDDVCRLVLARDGALKRPVILWMRHATDDPLSEARRHCARPTRPRWLASGTHEGWRWDAFPAPEGRPLTEVITNAGSLPWADVRPMLQDLTDELVAAARDGNLPSELTVGQIWLRPGRSAILFDVPLQRVNGADAEADTDSSLDLLGRAAVLALEGRPRPGAGRVRALIPRHAAEMMSRLLGGHRPFRSANEFRMALAETKDRPVEVTRVRRATHVAVLSGLLFFGLCGCMLPNAMLAPYLPLNWIANSYAASRHELQQMEVGAAANVVASTFNLQPLARPIGLVRLPVEMAVADQYRADLDRVGRQLQARVDKSDWAVRKVHNTFEEIRKQQAALGQSELTTPRVQPTRSVVSFANTVAIVMSLPGLVFWPVAWVFWALLFRGGLSYPLMGLALVCRDGRLAGHLRCAWRALIVWAPPAVLLIAAVLLDYSYWSADDRPKQLDWMLWVSIISRYTALVLLLAYPVLAICWPKRSVHDWLSGTRLVPR